MEWKDKIISFLLDNGPKLLGAVVIVMIGVFLARSVGKLILRWLSAREMEPPVRMLIVRICKLLVMAFMLVIALGTLGFNIMALVTGIGVAGVGVSLAMQGVLGNLVSGLLIIFTKPFRVGEYIEIIGVQGQVDSIDIFSTILVHADRSRVVIPNRKLVGEVLHNYGNIRQLDLTVGVAYGTDIPSAIRAVRDILRQNCRILKDFAPVIGVKNLGESSVDISVRPWTKVSDFGLAQAELYETILASFAQQKITIPFPQREIRLLNGAEVPPARTVVA